MGARQERAAGDEGRQNADDDAEHEPCTPGGPAMRLTVIIAGLVHLMMNSGDRCPAPRRLGGRIARSDVEGTQRVH